MAIFHKKLKKTDNFLSFLTFLPIWRTYLDPEVVKLLFTCQNQFKEKKKFFQTKSKYKVGIFLFPKKEKGLA